jgi:hypothetical protein
MANTPPVIRHIETHLGQMDPKAGHWRWDHADGTLLQVLAFRDRPRKGAMTLCSLGLGHHQFCSPRGHVRQELLVSCWDRFVSARLAGILPVAAQYALDQHVALQPWQVLGPAGPLVPGSAVEALLCLEPLFFPESFAICPSTNPRTEFVWLVPISRQEVAQIQTGRREELLARWESGEADILDWGRA